MVGRCGFEKRKRIGQLDYVFCSDAYLLNINKQFLNHDTYTDIITFDYTEDAVLGGEIYISIDRVKENALKFDVTLTEELCRVMVHGLLHLAGYKDKTAGHKQGGMRGCKGHCSRLVV